MEDINEANEIAKLRQELEELKRKVDSSRSRRGPKSNSKMCKEVAWAVRFGPYKSMAVREVAEILGLSYGQIYSARNLFTFKDIELDSMNPEEAIAKCDILIKNKPKEESEDVS